MHIYDDILHRMTPIKPSDTLYISVERRQKAHMTTRPDANGLRKVLGYIYEGYYCICIENGRRETKVLHFITREAAESELEMIAEAMRCGQKVYYPEYNTRQNVGIVCPGSDIYSVPRERRYYHYPTDAPTERERLVLAKSIALMQAAGAERHPERK